MTRLTRNVVEMGGSALELLGGNDLLERERLGYKSVLQGINMRWMR